MYTAAVLVKKLMQCFVVQSVKDISVMLLLLLLIEQLMCEPFQRISLLEEKLAELESWKLHYAVDCGQCGTCADNVCVGDDIEHLEERLHHAEAELARVNDSQRNYELQENRKVS